MKKQMPIVFEANFILYMYTSMLGHHFPLRTPLFYAYLPSMDRNYHISVLNECNDPMDSLGPPISSSHPNNVDLAFITYFSLDIMNDLYL